VTDGGPDLLDGLAEALRVMVQLQWMATPEEAAEAGRAAKAVLARYDHEPRASTRDAALREEGRVQGLREGLEKAADICNAMHDPFAQDERGRGINLGALLCAERIRAATASPPPTPPRGVPR
jgi:hypothetical protein